MSKHKANIYSIYLYLCRYATGDGPNCSPTAAQWPHNAGGCCSESTSSTGHLKMNSFYLNRRGQQQFTHRITHYTYFNTYWLLMNLDNVMLGRAYTSLQEIMVIQVTYYITSYLWFILIVEWTVDSQSLIYCKWLKSQVSLFLTEMNIAPS